jgi:hypothetical protein
MTRLEQVETAVESLSQEEYGRFRDWFLERDWERWDREIEADSAAGKLDFLLQEAQSAKAAGKLGRL